MNKEERAREKRMKYAKTAEKVAGPEENQLKDWAWTGLKTN